MATETEDLVLLAHASVVTVFRYPVVHARATSRPYERWRDTLILANHAARFMQALETRTVDIRRASCGQFGSPSRRIRGRSAATQPDEQSAFAKGGGQRWPRERAW